MAEQRKTNKLKVMFSKKSDHWKTPHKLYKAFMNQGYYDPCPYKCSVDNLNKAINADKVYINPPFSKLKDWCKFIAFLYLGNKDIYVLMPARTDTSYFYDLLTHAFAHIYFIKGRLHFNDSKDSAPFPTILIHLNLKTITSNTFDLCTLDEFIEVLK